MTSENEPKRLIFMDNLKIFFVILVIFTHVMVTYGGRGSWHYYATLNETFPIDIITAIVLYMIAVIISFGRRRLSFNHKWLKFLNQIAMPFYILHYVVSIPVQFYVVALPLGIIEKFLLISGISFVITIGLALIIRQFNPLRFLFGMSLRRDTQKN